MRLRYYEHCGVNPPTQRPDHETRDIFTRNAKSWIEEIRRLNGRKDSGGEKSADERANAQVYLAAACFALGHMRFAIQETQKALLIDPNNRKAKHTLALGLLNTGEYDRALTVIKEYIKDNKKLGDPVRLSKGFNTRGLIHAALGNQERAAKDFRLAFRYDPQNPPAARNVGEMLILEGNLPRALPYLELAVRLSPSVENRLVLASALDQAGRTDEGARIAADAMKDQELRDMKGTYWKPGPMLTQRMVLESTIRAIEFAIEQVDDKLSRIKKRQSSPDMAEIADSLDVAELAESYLKRGELNMMRFAHTGKGLEMAVDDFSSGLRYNPHSPHLLYALGMAECNLGRFDFALVYLSAAYHEVMHHETPPTTNTQIQLQVDILTWTGLAHQGKGEVEIALKNYLVAETLASGKEGVSATYPLNNIGETYLMRGDTALAEKYFRMALTDDPTHKSASLNLASLLHTRGEIDAALDIAVKGLEK